MRRIVWQVAGVLLVAVVAMVAADFSSKHGVLAQGQDPQQAHLLAASDELEARAATLVILQQSGDLPLDELRQVKDAWGTPLAVNLLGDLRQIGSLGPDRRAGTLDDFFIVAARQVQDQAKEDRGVAGQVRR